eukprot:5830712-Ditylum_brightwellii.AAC.1
MAGDEAVAAKKKMVAHLTKKWVRDYSEMCGYICTGIVLAVVQANTLLLRGAWDLRLGIR